MHKLTSGLVLIGLCWCFSFGCTLKINIWIGLIGLDAKLMDLMNLMDIMDLMDWPDWSPILLILFNPLLTCFLLHLGAFFGIHICTALFVTRNISLFSLVRNFTEIKYTSTSIKTIQHLFTYVQKTRAFSFSP